MAVFKDEFVPNIQTANRTSYGQWKQSNPNEAKKWEAYRDACIAFTGGTAPVAPSLSTKYGKALVAAGKLHTMSVTDIGSSPPAAQISHMLPASRTTLQNGEIAAWTVVDSATTDTPLGTNRAEHRIVHFGDPGSRYANPQKMYGLHGFRILQGRPGRLIDYHTSPADNPYGWSPYNCNPSNGGAVTMVVAPFAIDCFSGRGLEVVCEPEDTSPCGSGGSGNYHFTILSDAEVTALGSNWIWVWIEVLWGRKDSPYTAGAVSAWVAGENTPRVNKVSINTQWYGEHFVTLWEGAYHSGGSPGVTVVETAVNRIGHTPQECFNDTPVVYIREGAGPPNGTATAIADVEGGFVAVPASLQW